MQASMGRRLGLVGTLVVVVAMVVLVLATRDDPQNAVADNGDASVHLSASSRDLERTPLTDELKSKIDSWKQSGFIKDMMESSHEVFVDPEMWDSLDTVAKEERVKTLSRYLKTIDGTKQVIVRKYGSKAIAADYFADVLRIK